MTETKQKLIDFFNNKMGMSVSDDTKFFDDLELTGLDVDVFLDEFLKEFDIDMQYFSYSDYFQEEPFFPFQNQLRNLLGFKEKKKSLSLNDLLEIVDNKYWPQ